MRGCCPAEVLLCAGCEGIAGLLRASPCTRLYLHRSRAESPRINYSYYYSLCYALPLCDRDRDFCRDSDEAAREPANDGASQCWFDGARVAVGYRIPPLILAGLNRVGLWLWNTGRAFARSAARWLCPLWIPDHRAPLGSPRPPWAPPRRSTSSAWL